MARPPLVLETWGRIRRTKIGGKHVAVAYYRDSDGVTRKMQRQGPSPAAAERSLVEAMKQRLAPTGEDLTADRTVRQAAAKWLSEPERDELAIATLRRYRGILDTIVAKGLGDVRLGEATMPRVDRFLKRVTTENGPSTAKAARTVLQHVFALAVRHGAIRSNPVRDTAQIVQPKKPIVAPSVGDVRALRWIMHMYDTTPDKRGGKRVADLADLVDMFIATGARTAEVLALRWSDIDLDANPPTVSIHSTVVLGADGKVMVQDHPKTDSSRRTLLLPLFAGAMLTRRRVDSYCEWVFPSAAGTLRWPHNLRRAWREALEGTPYVNVTPRSLRKAVATHLRDTAGVEIAKDQLGHASSIVTRKHYIQPLHLGPDATVELSAWVQNGE